MLERAFLDPKLVAMLEPAFLAPAISGTVRFALYGLALAALTDLPFRVLHKWHCPVCPLGSHISSTAQFAL